MSKDLAVRLRERLRVYKDSPQVNVTYIDLAHLIEDLLEIIEDKEAIGFKKEKK